MTQQILTEKEKAILEIIERDPTNFHTPNKIGVALGIPLPKAAAYCYKSLDRLVYLGLIQRVLGAYRFIKK